MSAWARGLWIRRVLVRAQEGQYGRRKRGRFLLGGSGWRLELRRGNAKVRFRFSGWGLVVSAPAATLCATGSPANHEALKLRGGSSQARHRYPRAYSLSNPDWRWRTRAFEYLINPEHKGQKVDHADSWCRPSRTCNAGLPCRFTDETAA